MKKWKFPLKNYIYDIPESNHPGSFLKERKFHFHEGVDLYAKDREDVFAVEKGTVHCVIDFTGASCGSPWWNETKAIVIKGKSGYVLYGEVSPLEHIKKGIRIKRGERIANVKQVLKKRKSNPQAMLHIELYSKEIDEPIELIKNKRKRKKDDKIYKKIEKYGLIDPTPYLKKAIEKKDNVLLMVTGSISAYKSPDIARALVKSGNNVKVVLSKGAEEFVQKQVFGYLGLEVYSTEDDFKNKNVLHIDLARWADKVFLCPASANTIADIAAGKADSLVSSVFLSLKKRILKVIVPIMNTEMLKNSITQDNIKKIKKKYDCIFLEPDVGLLACGEYGSGKLPKTEQLVYLFNTICKPTKNKNIKFVVTAGATIAPIDSIRYVTNPAKGATGLLLAEELLRRGYSVCVIKGKKSLEKFDWLEKNPNCTVITVSTTRDLLKEVKKINFDVYISTMAVSDMEFDVSGSKLKKKDLNILNPKNAPDVLKWVLENRKNKNNFIVGFAAETELTEEVLHEKLKRKPVDCLVANVADGGFTSKIKRGFGSNNGEYKIITKRGVEDYFMGKKEIVKKIISTFSELYEKS